MVSRLFGSSSSKYNKELKTCEEEIGEVKEHLNHLKERLKMEREQRMAERMGARSASMRSRRSEVDSDDEDKWRLYTHQGGREWLALVFVIATMAALVDYRFRLFLGDGLEWMYELLLNLTPSS